LRRTRRLAEGRGRLQHEIGLTLAESARAVHAAVWQAGFYAATVRHVLPRPGLSLSERLRKREDRLVFVVGCPRSGTTFLAESIGALRGFVDLGEVIPLKASISRLAELSVDAASDRLRGQLETVRRLSLVQGLRGVEQTPELAFFLPAALRAYPSARVIHIVRDGRDVACSLLERGWLSATRHDRDDARQQYGPHARFWVEPELADRFEHVSDARRAAWAWRRYVVAARSATERSLEIRYEQLGTDPGDVAQLIGRHIDAPVDELAATLVTAHTDSVGRFRRELTSTQLEEVEDEAGPLLRDLGYEP
jgi:hypothetical protein